jgi:hypothetical protein
VAASEEAFFLGAFARGEAPEVDLAQLLFGFSVFVVDALRKELADVDFLGSAGSEGAGCLAGDGATAASASSFVVGFFRACDAVGDLVAALRVNVYPAIIAASLI